MSSILHLVGGVHARTLHRNTVYRVRCPIDGELNAPPLRTVMEMATRPDAMIECCSAKRGDHHFVTIDPGRIPRLLRRWRHRAN